MITDEYLMDSLKQAIDLLETMDYCQFAKDEDVWEKIIGSFDIHKLHQALKRLEKII